VVRYDEHFPTAQVLARQFTDHELLMLDGKTDGCMSFHDSRRTTNRPSNSGVTMMMHWLATIRMTAKIELKLPPTAGVYARLAQFLV
jgi:hypothetical protein